MRHNEMRCHAMEIPIPDAKEKQQCEAAVKEHLKCCTHQKVVSFFFSSMAVACSFLKKSA